MLKIETLVTENIKGLNNNGFSHFFNNHEITCLYFDDKVVLNDLFETLLCTKNPISGRIIVNDYSLTDLSNYSKVITFNENIAVIDGIDETELKRKVGKELKSYAKLINYDKENINKSVDKAISTFNLRSLSGEKVESLSNKNKIDYLFARAFCRNKNNVIINIDEQLITKDDELNYFISNVKKFNSFGKECIVLTTNEKIWMKFTNIVSLKDINVKIYPIEELLVIDKTKTLKTSKISFNNYFKNFVNYFNKYLWYYLGIFFVSILTLVLTNHTLASLIDQNFKFDSGIIVELVFCCLLAIGLIVYFWLITYKLNKKNINKLTFFSHHNCSNQIMFSYLPLFMFVLSISSIGFSILISFVMDVAFLNYDLNLKLILLVYTIYFLIFIISTFLINLRFITREKNN